MKNPDGFLENQARTFKDFFRWYFDLKIRPGLRAWAKAKAWLQF